MDEQRPESVRSFVLLRQLSKGKTLTSEETHELLENHYNMAGANVIARIETQISRLDAHIQAMNAKHDALVERMDAKHDALVERMDTKHDALVERMDAKNDALVAKMDARHDAFVESLSALKNSMERQHSTFLWVIGIATALLGAIQIFT